MSNFPPGQRVQGPHCFDRTPPVTWCIHDLPQTSCFWHFLTMAYHGTYAYDILWHLMTSYDIQVHKNDWNLKVVSGLCHVTSTRFHGRCQGLKPYRKQQELTSWHTSHLLLWISEVNFLWLPASPVGMWPCGRGRKEAGRRCLASLRLNRLKPGDNDIHLEKLAKKRKH